MKSFEEMEKDATEGNVPDSQNPLFLFSAIDSKMLFDIVSGEIDAVELAKHTLNTRHGDWMKTKLKEMNDSNIKKAAELL